MKMFVAAVVLVAACDGGGSSAGDTGDDVPADANANCNPATVLPTTWRLNASVATTAVNVTNAGGMLTGTIDASAGGSQAAAADQPYIYFDLSTGAKVETNDVDARDNLDWDIALKRSSLKTNSGDSGGGRRKMAVVQGTSLAITAPESGYVEDDFTDDNCEYMSIPGGEPMSAFGYWYEYDDMTHAVTPLPEVYVIERNDGSRVALRFTNWASGVFSIEAKALPDA